MAQQIAANGLAESVMAFNTNYSDSGLFGVYAVAKVCFSSFELLQLIAWCNYYNVIDYCSCVASSII